MELPKLRELEAFPVSVSGRQMIGLRDPMNFSSETLAVPKRMHLLLVLLDGRHSVLDIQAEYMRASGELIYKETIEETLQRLDEGLFLDNENFRRKREEIENAFKQAGSRPAALAGKSYDDSPDALAAQIEGFFTHAEGPGPLERDRAETGVKGIIAPHIDFMRGGPCFAWAYKELAERSDADVFIIFGTAHARTSAPFVITYKNFETPFGALPCERGILEATEKKVSWDLSRDEFVHRNEHSIEFQTIFLRYLYRGKRDISIVPILCGSFHEMLDSRTSPMDDERVREFVVALREAVAESGKKTCCVASADLAHIGPRFGDPHPVGENFLRLLEAEDLRMLERLENVDADGFFAHIEADGDRRRICGLPPIYTMLNAMEATSGKLLKYQCWPDPAGAVSYASMAFY